MKNSIMAVGLSASLLFSSMGGASAASVHYKDIKKDDNYYSAVANLLDQKAVSRTLEKFRPNENVTRGQAASIIAKVLELDIENVEDPKFKDVPKDNQFYKYVAALENEGIIGGRSDGTFGINEPLKRGQMAAILVKAFDIPLIGGHDIGMNAFIDNSSYMGNGTDDDSENDDYMGDVWLVLRGQFTQEIETLNYYGYVSGYKTRWNHGDGTPQYEFKKGKSITRSQLALMIEKIQKGTQYEYLYFEDFNIANRSVAHNGWKTDKAEIDDPSIISLEEISNYETNVWLEGLHHDHTVNNVYAILKPKKDGKTFARFDDGGTGKEKVIEITVKESDGKFEVTYKDVTPK